jgi:rRNA maturation endonuclease Nob1
MKQITLAIIFVALMFGTSFAFDCPKCKAEMTEEEDKYICPKCGSIVPITRTKIYNEPTVEKKIGTDVEEKGRKSQQG